MNDPALRLACLTVLVAASSSTCLVPDPNHCAHRPTVRGHAFCRERFPDFPLCSRCETSNEHNGCTADDTHVECLIGSPDPEEALGSSEGSTTTGTDTTGVPACDPTDCEAEDPTRPLCGDQGLCISCNEAGGDPSCAAADAERPVCLTEDGSCVRCTEANPGVCSGATPVCDVATQTCIPCDYHWQCLATWGSACDIETHECLPTHPSAIRHVDGSKTVAGDGSEERPFQTIEEALEAFPFENKLTIVLHEFRNMSGVLDYDEAVVVDGGRTVAIVAPKRLPQAPSEDDPPLPAYERPRITSIIAGGLITASGSGTIVYLDGLTVHGNSDGASLRVAAWAKAYVDRCELTESDFGVEVNGDGTLLLRNSVVTTILNSGTAVSLSDSATADITYSTLFNTGPAGIDAVRCEPGASVTVRNSIILARSNDGLPSWNCADGSVTHSAGKDLPSDESLHNRRICEAAPDLCEGDAIATLFDDLATLRLVAHDPDVFVGAPLAAATDPPFDIDFDPRPGNSIYDHAGADGSPSR